MLLMLTSNGERELPPAFLRRCLVVTMQPPSEAWFVQVATQKFGAGGQALHKSVAQDVMRLRPAAQRAGLRRVQHGRSPGRSQRLPRPCVHARKQSLEENLARTVLWKHEKPPELDESEAEAT